MSNEKTTRDTLITFLKGGNAYMPISEIVANFPEKEMNMPFPNGTYTPWDLLEHIRITQWDIIEFITNSEYKEMKWPDEYWPPKDKKATSAMWKKTVLQYEKDLQEVQKIVENPKIDLYAKIPHGSGQTIFREILLIIDHNAYHLGEFAIMRQVMKTWGKTRK